MNVRPAAGERPLAPFLRFFALALLITWACWLPLAASALGWIDARPSPYFHLLGALGPALAAMIVCFLEGPRSVARLARRSSYAPWPWVVAALVGPVAVYLVAAAALLALGYDVDLAATGRSVEYPELGLIGYAIANVVAYGFGEEIGWRGFVLPRLQRRFDATRASLIVAAIWAIWHLPLFAFAGGMSRMGPAEIAGWAVSLISGSFLMASLLNASGGSVVAVALFHGTLDIVINSPTGGPLQTAMGALVTIAGLSVPFRFGRESLAPRPRVIDPEAPAGLRDP